MKRFIDLVLVIVTAPIWLPLLLLLALVVRVKLGQPVFFRQPRPGRHGQIFNLVKFRTMTDALGPGGELLPDQERLVPFGRWLRSTSLDELPEFFNVLLGNMSLVGPRPLMVEYLALYDANQARRHDVLPGVTGWAQINGRNAISWEERLAMDTWYVEHQTIRLDLSILARTVGYVLRRSGVSHDGHDTMPRFTGSKS